MVLKTPSICKWYRNHTKAAKRGYKDYRVGGPLAPDRLDKGYGNSPLTIMK